MAERDAAKEIAAVGVSLVEHRLQSEVVEVEVGFVVRVVAEVDARCSLHEQHRNNERKYIIVVSFGGD